jgi:hypothetical protein
MTHHRPSPRAVHHWRTYRFDDGPRAWRASSLGPVSLLQRISGAAMRSLKQQAFQLYGCVLALWDAPERYARADHRDRRPLPGS